jgi:hypothetical protein
MKFQSAAPGQITAIRYWKASSESGTHVGHLWSATGILLATATFTNETAGGWQQQALATPLSIQAGTTYVVSVNINSYYVDVVGGLATSVVNGDLSSVADGQNGVFGSAGNFPTASFNNSNYFRDIIFTPGWGTTVPLIGSDEIFLSGVGFPVPANFQAGINPVTWNGTFSTNTPGVSLQWKWGAAAYTCFPTDYNLLNVKPTHQNACTLNNGDHAGTPENRQFRQCLIGGASSGGGSNFTGSWSGTVNVTPVCP